MQIQFFFSNKDVISPKRMKEKSENDINARSKRLIVHVRQNKYYGQIFGFNGLIII